MKIGKISSVRIKYPRKHLCLLDDESSLFLTRSVSETNLTPNKTTFENITSAQWLLHRTRKRSPRGKSRRGKPINHPVFRKQHYVHIFHRAGKFEFAARQKLDRRRVLYEGTLSCILNRGENYKRERNLLDIYNFIGQHLINLFIFL